MARKLRLQYAGGIYHVTFRGNAKQDIFIDEADRHRMKRRLAEAHEDYGVRIYLYCFMSNHVHLLLETPTGNLSQFMGGVLTGYSVYFNRRYQRVGHVMQGRFGAQVVQGDSYLLRLSRYIHLNPVNTSNWPSRPLEKRLTYLHHYPWSSFRAYSGLVKEESWVDYEPLRCMVPGRGASPRKYRSFVETGLYTPDEEFIAIRRESSLAIGDDLFIEKVHKDHEESAQSKRREDISLRGVRTFENPDEVLAELAQELKVSRSDFFRKRRDGRIRAIAAFTLIRRCGFTQRQVADLLGMKSGSSVSYLVRMHRDTL